MATVPFDWYTSTTLETVNRRKVVNCCAHGGSSNEVHVQIEMGTMPASSADPSMPPHNGHQQSQPAGAAANEQAKTGKRVTVVSPRSQAASGKLPEANPEAKFTLDDDEKID